MPRLARAVAVGFAHHITQRGNNKQGVFFVDEDRRVDILDNGSLKIQYNRNRYYDYYTGRWTTQDPLGTNPAGGTENLFSLPGQYANGLNLYEYVSNSPTNSTDELGLFGPIAPCPGLKEKAINKLAAFGSIHSSYKYYWVTGFNTTTSKLSKALQWLGSHQYLHRPKSGYNSWLHTMYLNTTGPLSGINIFHEAIHAYNDMSGFGLSNRQDEGVAYAAERMTFTLNTLRALEQRLDESEPSRERLEPWWQHAWERGNGANGVIGYKGRYHVSFWAGWSDFTVTWIDVKNVENVLGFDLTCGGLAYEYNKILEKKEGVCWPFTCATKGRPWCKEDDIVLKEGLHSVFH